MGWIRRTNASSFGARAGASFSVQRNDRVEAGCLVGELEAEEDTGDGRHAGPGDDGNRRYEKVPVGESANPIGGPGRQHQGGCGRCKAIATRWCSTTAVARAPSRLCLSGRVLRHAAQRRLRRVLCLRGNDPVR